MSDRAKHVPRRSLLLGGAAAVAAGLGINALAPRLIPEKMEFGINESHWSLALPPANPPPRRDLRADAIVIGGGFSGLSAAHYLRQTLPRARVVVLEAVRCGNGASGRNGAMMMTSTADTYLNPGTDPDLDHRLYELTRDNIARVRRLSTATGIDCELDQFGSVQVASTKDDADRMATSIRGLHAAGIPAVLWTAEEVAQILGTRAYRAGVYEPGSGQVHPGKLVALWKHAAEHAGVEIFEGVPVVDVEEGPIIRLSTANGVTASAPILVLAANAYSSKLGYLRNTVAPIVNHVAITPPLTAKQIAATGWSKRVPFNDTRTNVVYAGLTRDGRIHIGGGIEQYEFNNGLGDPGGHAAALGFLRNELIRLYPSLKEVPFERSWWGFVDMTIDEAPSVGRMGRHGNILYAIGLSGQGVNLTSVLGRIIGDLAAGREAAWTWFPYLNRLPPYCPNEPFRWLGVETAIRLVSA